MSEGPSTGRTDELLLVAAGMVDQLCEAIDALTDALTEVSEQLEGVPNANDMSALLAGLTAEQADDDETPHDLWDGTKPEERYAGVVKKP